MSHVNKKQQDGGYYALKGYLYQFNKTIKKILESDDENKKIGFEREQDIDDEDSIIQIKYKEGSKFSNSSIKKPIIQLIEHYQLDNAKNFILECYFQDKSNEIKSIDLNQLNNILRNDSSKFNDQIKTGFIAKFKLIFSDDFNSSFEAIVNKIKSTFNCKNGEEFSYQAIISSHLLQTVVNNKSGNKSSREVSICDLKAIINNSKTSIFLSTHREILGNEKYFSMIKKKYLSFSRIDDWERFFIIEIDGSESISDLKECVLKIREKFYITSSKTIKSGAPFIFLNGISQKNLVKLKTELLLDNYILKDGFDFQGAKFNQDSIQEKSSIDNKISIKFLNKESHLFQVLPKNFGKTKEVYQFFINKPLALNLDLKNCKIQVSGIKDIISIFKN